MWVGAALLFVLTSVTEQVEPAFETAIRDRLALIRFPWYYGTGAVLLTVGIVTGAAISRGRRTILIATLVLLAAASAMAADYALVYRPLRASLTPPGAARDAEFQRLHEWSERLNAGGFLLSAVAAVMLCATGGRGRSGFGEGD